MNRDEKKKFDVNGTVGRGWNRKAHHKRERISQNDKPPNQSINRNLPKKERHIENVFVVHGYKSKLHVWAQRSKLNDNLVLYLTSDI